MKISLGMIVRNEGQTLERCLKSVVPFVDEVIIGLAGESTDDTEAIARMFTGDYFNIEWKDNFSDARNQVLEKVTGDWFLWLDGDDELIGGENLRAYPEQYPNVGAFHMGYDYSQDEFGQSVTYLIRERLVRMDLGWTWKGRVHEVLTAKEEHQAHLIEDIVVRHNHKEKDRSGTRNLDLLYKDLEETEPNPSQRLLLYLGNENASRGNFKEALLHWRRFLNGAQFSEETYQIAHKMADVYRAMGDFQKAEQADFDAIKIAPHWPDAYFGLAETAYQQGRWLETVEWTKCGSTKNAPTTSLIVNPHDYDYYPLRILALAYARLNNYEEALDNLQRAYKIVPDPEMQELFDGLHHEIEAQEVRKAFLRIYQHLGRHDEWLKARDLFKVAPKIIETDPVIQEAWYRTSESTRHIEDPQVMVDYYVNNPGWVPIDDDFIKNVDWRYGRIAFARSVAESVNPNKILDVGSSDGFISLPLASLGHRIYGVDLDPRCIELANSRADAWGLPAQYIQGTIDKISPEATPEYDLALAFEIIEHLVDPGDFLDQLEKRAKHIAITTPFLAWEGGRLQNWDKVELKGHIRIFDIADVERLISNRGRIHNLYREPWGRSSWIFADYEAGATTDKNVTIITGNTLEQWGPRKLAQEGLGGSETAVIKLGEALADLGNKVTVYGRIDEDGIYNKVIYRDNSSFFPDVHSDVFIAWRYPEIADLHLRADRLILWMHDTDAGDRLTKDRARRFDQIVVLSEWHKSHMMKMYPFIPEAKYVIIGNGVDRNRFGGRTDRDPHRVVYASSPDRGLDIILEHIWPVVTSAIPDASLHVYYGWGNIDIVGRVHEHIREFKLRVSELLLHNVNVVQHGRVDQKTLAEEFEKASIWLYPTYFPETYCITAVEAQAAGLVPITNNKAALAEVVRSGVCIDGDVHDPVVARKYADAVIAAMEDSDIDRDAIRERAPVVSWEDRAKQWLEML